MLLISTILWYCCMWYVPYPEPVECFEEPGKESGRWNMLSAVPD